MKVLAQKTEKKILFIFDFIIGILIMIVGVVLLPVIIYTTDPELFKEWIIILLLLIEMPFFILVGYFANIRQIFLYKKAPKIQAETDGQYLYLHGKQEIKIPLSDMKDAELDAVIPYRMSREFIIHLLSEKYGKVVIKVPNYGKFKLYFISGAEEVVQEIYRLIAEKNN